MALTLLSNPGRGGVPLGGAPAVWGREEVARIWKDKTREEGESSLAGGIGGARLEWGGSRIGPWHS